MITPDRLDQIRRGHQMPTVPEGTLRSWIAELLAEAKHLKRRDEISTAGLALAHRRQAEYKADRDRARDAAVALEQEVARQAEECARLLSAASAAYQLPPAEVLAAVREEMAAERGEGS